MAVDLATIRSDVGFRARDPNAVFFTNTEIDRWANKVQFDLARRTKFLKQDKAFRLVKDQPYILLPTDFITLDTKPVYKTAYGITMRPRLKYWRIPYQASGLATGTDPLLGTLEYTRVADATRWKLFLWPTPSADSANSTINQGGGIGAGDTTVTLTSVSSFDNAGRIVIESEEIYYTGRNTTTNVLSGLLRGMGGTSAAAHANATTVYRADIVLVYSRIPATITATVNAEIPDEDYPTLLDGILSIAFESQRRYELATVHMKEYRDGIREMRRKFGNSDEGEDCALIPDPAYDWSYGEGSGAPWVI